MDFGKTCGLQFMDHVQGYDVGYESYAWQSFDKDWVFQLGFFSDFDCADHVFGSRFVKDNLVFGFRYKCSSRE